MQSHNYSYEIIFLDDGVAIIHGLLSKDLLNKTLTLRAFVLKNFGKSQALHAGLLKLKVMSLLLWMLTCKTVLRKFRVYMI
jgi:hypothetical protein